MMLIKKLVEVNRQIILDLFVVICDPVLGVVA